MYILMFQWLSLFITTDVAKSKSLLIINGTFIQEGAIKSNWNFEAHSL